MSPKEALNVLESDSRLHAHVQYLKFMYENSNKCFFQCPDGSFIQEDGFPQGDPLSPARTCLVINQIPINAMLQTQANARQMTQQHSDDSCGSKSTAPAYFDDTFSSHMKTSPFSSKHFNSSIPLRASYLAKQKLRY
jgi:hypothetical protein